MSSAATATAPPEASPSASRPAVAERDADRADDERRAGESREVVDPDERRLPLPRPLSLELRDDAEELEEAPRGRRDAPRDERADERHGVDGRPDEEHASRGAASRTSELREADGMARRRRSPRRGATAVASEHDADEQECGGQPEHDPGAEEGLPALAAARSPAATSTQAIAASASVTSTDVDPTPSESVGWYVAWRKRNGTRGGEGEHLGRRVAGDRPHDPGRRVRPGAAARPSRGGL